MQEKERQEVRIFAKSLEVPQKLYIPSDLMEKTLEHLREKGKRGHEGFVVWAGSYTTHAHRGEGQGTSAVWIMDQFPAGGDHSAVNATFTQKDMENLLNEVSVRYHKKQMPVFAAGMIHSHPDEAWHSNLDDRAITLLGDGAISIVLPRFARNVTVENFFLHAQVYALRNDRVTHLSPDEVRELIVFYDRQIPYKAPGEDRQIPQKASGEDRPPWGALAGNTTFDAFIDRGAHFVKQFVQQQNESIQNERGYVIDSLKTIVEDMSQLLTLATADLKSCARETVSINALIRDRVLKEDAAIQETVAAMKTTAEKAIPAILYKTVEELKIIKHTLKDTQEWPERMSLIAGRLDFVASRAKDMVTTQAGILYEIREVLRADGTARTLGITLKGIADKNDSESSLWAWDKLRRVRLARWDRFVVLGVVPRWYPFAARVDYLFLSGGDEYERVRDIVCAHVGVHMRSMKKEEISARMTSLMEKLSPPQAK